MERSTERILTTHTGSLPRPAALMAQIVARERREPIDEAEFADVVRAGVAETVRHQLEVGLDIIDDGEMSKVSYVGYIKDRFDGFGGESQSPASAEPDDFPEFTQRMRGQGGRGTRRPACIGPVSYRDFAAVEYDLANFREALDDVDPTDTFLTAASPGVIPAFFQNQYYPSHEAYLWALADVLKPEYDAIHRAGFIVQIDCPDLAMGRHMQFAQLSFEEWRKKAAESIEALNYATRDIPPEGLRMHVCWGNGEGPHHKDVPLHDIVDLLLTARPSAISFVGANPRHGHEWKVWQDVNLPPEKILIPGVIDTTTNFIEHPELVAERIERYASVVGRERVIAGADCGFWGGSGGLSLVDGQIAWAKLGSLAEGARLASQALW